MAITDVTFERLSAQDAATTSMVMRVNVLGPDLSIGNVQWYFSVGNQPVEFLIQLSGDQGMTGLIKNTPQAQDPLFVSIDGGPFVDTGFKFDPLIV